MSTEMIERLAGKSNEFKAYSANEMVDLCTELLYNFRERRDEWSNADSWGLKDIKVQELYHEGQCEPLSKPASLALSTSKHMISSIFSKFVTTCKENYKYEAGITTKKPELLSKVNTKTMQDGSDRVYSVYGPVSTGVPGNSFELYTLPLTDRTPQKKPSTTNPGYISVVLGAGNQTQLTLFDILNRTLIHREVVLAKHNPVRSHLIVPYAIILEPLIKRGFFVQIRDEGIPATQKILSHPSVGHVHITGSLATDIAVRSTIAKSKPQLSTAEVEEMVSSECGASTPFILAPGEYTKKEITHSARMAVFGKKLNGGCNCLNFQVVIIPKEWKQKGEFRKALYDELRRQPNQPAYYPGSRERIKDMVQVYKALGEERVKVIQCKETTGTVNKESDNIAVVECGSPGEVGYNDTALKREAFGPLISIVELPLPSVETDYLNSVAVPFVNNKNHIFGSLSACLISPSGFDAKELDRAVESIEYGAIGVNTPPLICFLGANLGGIWCAHPSAPGRESGMGYNGNQFKIAAPAKSVVRGPTLANNSTFDGASPPPKFIIEAIHIMDCSHTTLAGTARILYLLFITLLKAILTPLIPAKKIKTA